MLRHVVCLTWKPGTAAGDVEAVRAALVALPATIPEIRAYRVGTDLGLVEGNADFGVVADFDDADAWRIYQSHPEHVRIITELIRPHLAARTAVQFDVSAWFVAPLAWDHARRPSGHDPERDLGHPPGLHPGVLLAPLRRRRSGCGLPAAHLPRLHDWVDGYIARHFDQGSDLGKILDPTVDRLLLLVAVVALMVDGSVPVVLGVLVLVREVVVGGATLALAIAGARRIDVLWAGKAGTLAIMVAFPSLLIAHHTYATWHVIGLVVGWGFAIPAWSSATTRRSTTCRWPGRRSVRARLPAAAGMKVPG